MWIAKKPLDLGHRRVMPGQPVPEAKDWPNRDSYLKSGDLSWQSDEKEPPLPQHRDWDAEGAAFIAAQALERERANNEARVEAQGRDAPRPELSRERSAMSWIAGKVFDADEDEPRTQAPRHKRGAR